MTLFLSICYLAYSVVDYSMINRFVAACFKNLLFDACMLIGSGNRLLFHICKKLLRRQVFREFYRSQAGLNFMHACLYVCHGLEIHTCMNMMIVLNAYLRILVTHNVTVKSHF